MHKQNDAQGQVLSFAYITHQEPFIFYIIHCQRSISALLAGAHDLILEIN